MFNKFVWTLIVKNLLC